MLAETLTGLVITGCFVGLLDKTARLALGRIAASVAYVSQHDAGEGAQEASRAASRVGPAFDHSGRLEPLRRKLAQGPSPGGQRHLLVCRELRAYLRSISA